MKKKALVIHSGGMDSSICLALASREWGKEQVLSVSFFYGQRHAIECQHAEKICREWGIDHELLKFSYPRSAASISALLDANQPIQDDGSGILPNTWVCGRNGLLVNLGAIYAHSLGIQEIYLGVMEEHSGYPDCTREYMDLMEKVMQLDLMNPHFKIVTPLVKMTKKQTMEVADKLGILEFLLKETVTCYEGLPQAGCGICPSCRLRQEGLKQFLQENPSFRMSRT